jgi:phage tail-like protein
MNVNGARFHLLLGRDDWRRCRGGDGRTLASWWDDIDSPMPTPPDDLPEWDDARHEIALRAQGIALPATFGEALLTIEARRAAAADRHGNLYRIADDRASLRVVSAGSGNETPFWPAEPADCAASRARERLAFETHAPVAAVVAARYLALAVTDDDYLVVAFARDGARGEVRGLLAFDLISGGEPNETAWPAALAIEPFDLRRRHGGGAWLLDRAHRRLWELDCTLAMVDTGQAMRVLDPPDVDDFQPQHGPARMRAETRVPEGLDLAALADPLHDPVAIAPFGEDAVLVLDRDDVLQRSRVVRLRRSGAHWHADASHWLDALPAQAHDMVHATGLARAGCAPAAQAQARLFVATGIGNQLHAFEVIDDARGFQLRAPAELHPLRRYGGRALVSLQGAAHYDSGAALPRWVRVVQQHRQRFATHAVMVTPVFDSEAPGTVWDKLLLDACIPPDTEVRIESRSSDERVVQPGGMPASADADGDTIGDWRPEPTPRLRSAGPELPWLRREAVRDTDRGNGVGTWELLLQHAQGRYLQLRIRLASAQGTMTPRLRALRAWAPRFSYPQRFLPALYREDEGHGNFLERWLANMESTCTGIEDRIAHLEALFDPRTVPQDALPWLAQWFDLALDPSWDERRHRLLVRHAMDFFRWRGTVHGLRTALSLAFDRAFDPAMFDGPTPDDEGAGRMRIVEAYLTRITDGLVARANAGPPATTNFGLGPGAVVRGTLWHPAEGNAGLVDRYAASQGREADPVELLTPFPLVAPGDADAAAAWSDFCRAQLGVVPSAGAAERLRWQAYLRARYASVEAVNAAHAAQHAAFDAIALPPDLPANALAAADWRAFRDRGESREPALWHDFLARRHRRIERLRTAHGTRWTRFEDVPLPDRLPAAEAAQTDWLQFERQLLAMHRSAHRFSVLLPMSEVEPDPHLLDQRLALARRIVDLEKPAHTVFDVRFFWAFNRIGEARLGLDTQLGAGSRASELIPTAVVGRAYIGASFVGGDAPQRGRDRLSIEC